MTNFWENKRVFITGHTGFKGAWLCHLLDTLGAKLCGYALEPHTSPNLFTLTALEESVEHHVGTLLDFDHLKECIDTFAPDVIFHLAAQALVRDSYDDPVGTYQVNVLGTVHLLEAIRIIGKPTVVINVTTDKCYENKEWIYPYREIDRLGGHDPYSNSKACSELVTNCYNDSFFKQEKGRIALASARAGNVIGGGDWAKDRLIPDCVRSVENNEKVQIRNPRAVRPWQHVLDPLNGYILLAKKLYENAQAYGGGWNFGPSPLDFKPVSWMADQTVGIIGGEWEVSGPQEKNYHEANYLTLDSSKAMKELGWHPKLSVDKAITWTAEWYKHFLSDPATVKDVTCAQIKEFLRHDYDYGDERIRGAS